MIVEAIRAPDSTRMFKRSYSIDQRCCVSKQSFKTYCESMKNNCALTLKYTNSDWRILSLRQSFCLQMDHDNQSDLAAVLK